MVGPRWIGLGSLFPHCLVVGFLAVSFDRSSSKSSRGIEVGICFGCHKLWSTRDLRRGPPCAPSTRTDEVMKLHGLVRPHCQALTRLRYGTAAFCAAALVGATLTG